LSWQATAAAKQEANNVPATMASEIFGIAALFWVLIPVGLLGGALLIKFADGD
jgi:cytochrome b6-f complex subunit 7